jgi:hypothetical protein
MNIRLTADHIAAAFLAFMIAIVGIGIVFLCVRMNELHNNNTIATDSSAIITRVGKTPLSVIYTVEFEGKKYLHSSNGCLVQINKEQDKQ